MYKIIETEQYATWFSKLRDRQARARILARLRRIEIGNFGDHKSLGNGISELRFTYGPGYRIYYTLRGEELVILLVGGDKSSQERDIQRAIELADELGDIE